MHNNLYYFEASQQEVARLFENENKTKKGSLIEVLSPNQSQVNEVDFKTFYQLGRTLGIKPQGFTPKAFFFDMDSTVIGQETIVELAEAAGKRSEVEKITERAMQGELDFAEALHQRVAVLKDLPESILSLTQPRLVIEPGLKKFAELTSSLGINCYLISGGFIELAKPIADELNFAGCHANRLEVINGRLTGKITGEIVDAQSKAQYLKKTCSELGLSTKEVVAVGDGANDLLMMELAGLSIGYKPKSALYSVVDALNHSGSHAFLIDFLLSRNQIM
jgi:phosphoserine phosphatase